MSTQRPSDGLLRVILIVLAAVLLIPLVTMSLTMPMMGMMGGMWGGRTGGAASPLWGLGMLLVWLVVIGGGGYLLYRALSGGGPSGTDDRALEELRMAYARGDLTDEEFEERRERLGGDGEGG